MNRNNLWKFIIVVLVVVWSFVEMYPPIGRDLVQEFKDKAIGSRKDAAYTNILERLEKLQQITPQRAFGNLVEAVGTNDITLYFPQYPEAKSEAYPSRAVLNLLQRDAAGKIHLGLDLQGGTSFLVGMDPDWLAANTNGVMAQQGGRETMLYQAVEVLRKRVDKIGVAEPIIQPEGDSRILIQLPGLSDADKDRARENIKKAAYLELRMVHPDSAKLLADGLSEPGYEVLRLRSPLTNGQTFSTNMLVERKPVLTGKHITTARVNRDTLGRPEIEFNLDPEGADIFASVTRENVGHFLAIVLDGDLISAPRIQTAIEGGGVVITGKFTDKEAEDLASALENPLQVPLKILSESNVDPTLGSDTVKSGVRSALIGTLLVAGFMACYYMFAGAVADVALITNIIILLGVMCYSGTTFTLPGIAGVVLTIGMAVDANVLIFERIREESAKGKSLRGALSAGYDRAFGTIFDSHVTTLITSIVLFYMGTGPIKGFGATLTIGVAASLFTALVVTRLIFDFLIGKGWLKSLPMLHIIRAVNLDFMKLAKPAFILSWTIIAVGIGYGVYRVEKGNLFGPDFVGGDSVTLSFSQEIPADKLRASIARDADVKEPVIQYQKDLVTGVAVLRITLPSDTAAKVVGVLVKDFPEAKFQEKESQHIGATIGAEIQQAAIAASFVSLICILFYVAVRYEFSFAVGAVLAILHDVLMTIGCYCLTGLFGEGRQFNATMVAAILTIIGFSINDTIVIFDRIREDLKLGMRGSFKEVINQALNQTLSRTIITSGTVFLATMSLYLFGGGAINDFAFTFLVGIITGTYSSIYIASALVLWWHKGARPKTGSQVVMTTATASPVKS
jgi:SecD/SecF fusion protein